ncbi:MAG: magnesium/cobalt transporter CorA [Spirochaetales bacterium]|nr:magnesium/cobalt transporter CorA [Spirochaetales bacterium]
MKGAAMGRFSKDLSKKISLIPGTVRYVGDEKFHQISIHYFNYNETNFQENHFTDPTPLEKLTQAPGFHWINIDGIHDVSIIEKLGHIFKLHSLTLEDIANTTQRPKFEDFSEYLFYVLKRITFNRESGGIVTEQISLILKKNIVISLQEHAGDSFASITTRIRENLGRIRKMQSDYLFYILADAVIDQYFVVLEDMGEEIEALDEEIIEKNNSNIIHRIHQLKGDILYLRKSVWPLREINSLLSRLDIPFFTKEVRLFLRDLHDHCIQVADTLESYRDMASGLMDIHLTLSSNKLNEVMKILTIFASIFIPITFVAGWYGMNFKYMPELDSPLAYPLVALLTLGTSVVMLFYFRKKGWIGRKKKKAGKKRNR